jgi:anti-sigma factor (TIGR02949 family)
MVVLISCEEVFRAVSDYVDGELGAEFRERLERHFADCSHCTAVLDGTRNLLSLVGSPDAIEVPAGFSDRLRLRIERQREGVSE